MRFILPKGLREGPQNQFADVQIDTTNLDPGSYELFALAAGCENPRGENQRFAEPAHRSILPILANQGEATQHYVLKGERLGLLSKLQAPGASFGLGAPTPDLEPTAASRFNLSQI